MNEFCFAIDLKSFTHLTRTFHLLKSIFFWDMTPCSALSGTRRFGGTYRLHLQGCRTVSERASKRHIPEEDTLQNHRCENLKTYISLILCNFKQIILAWYLLGVSEVKDVMT
jgi:hypothetical protein